MLHVEKEENSLAILPKREDNETRPFPTMTEYADLPMTRSILAEEPAIRLLDFVDWLGFRLLF